MSEQVHVFDFAPGDAQRLDQFLTAQMPQFTRSRLKSLIQDGRVSVDGKLATKAGLKLEDSERVEVRIPPPAPSGLHAESIPLEIAFENRDLLVINKPAGMVVHPAAGHASGTLVNAVLAHAPDIQGIGGEQRPGLVHRLDKETSGLIVLAKNDAAHQFLQEQFRKRQVKKTYIALVDGHPPTLVGRVEAAIGRDTTQRKQMRVVPDRKGRLAVSEYKTLEKFPEHTLLEVRIHTGRTHQIRVHTAFIGCPIVGDKVYGRRKPSLPLRRHFLHAAELSFLLPGESEPRTFKSPLPLDLSDLLVKLRS